MTITGISILGAQNATIVAAPYAPAGPLLAGTSDSSVIIGEPLVTFVMNEFGLGFVPGVRIRASAQVDPTRKWMEGVVTGYVDNVLSVTTDFWGDIGDPFTGWNINVAGLPGQTGDAGPQGPPGPPGGLVQGVLEPFGIDGDNNLTLNYNATLHVAGQLGIAQDVILPGMPSAGSAPALGDNSNKLATTGFVFLTSQPLDGDLTSLAAAAAINVIYYRSAADTWAPVTIGPNLSFASGVLDAIPAQPSDPDLIALAALTGTNTIYYRSAPDTWSPVTMGTNMNFSGGVLSAAGGSGGGGFITGVNPPFVAPAGVLGLSYINTTLNVDGSGNLTIADNAALPGTPTVVTPPAGGDNSNKVATTLWVRTWGGAKADLASPTFTGDPKAPTPATADNDTSIATTAYVQANLANYTPTAGLASFAPLASPALTGSPTAPTPAPGDNDTSIATTAFVAAALAATSTQPVGFRAHKNGVNQSITSAPLKLTFGTEAYDIGGYYDTATSRWTPPPGIVHLTASMMTGPMTAATQELRILKNGALFSRSVNSNYSQFDGQTVVADDVASGSDYYEVECYLTTAGALIADGRPDITYFEGHLTGGSKGDTGATGAPGAALAAPTPPQGRLTLAANTPVMTINATNIATLRYAPYLGNRIPIWDGTQMTMMGFVELTCLLSDTTKNPTAVGPNQVHDWFVWNDAGVLRLSHGPAWSSDTVRSAGTVLGRVAGIPLNNVAITNGPPAQRGTWVGTTASNASSTIDWQFGGSAVDGIPGIFGVWNAYNRVSISSFSHDLTASWNRNATGPIPAKDSLKMRVYAVFGAQEDVIDARYYCCHAVGSPGAYQAEVGVGIDTQTAYTGDVPLMQTGAPGSGGCKTTQLGFHYWQALESSTGTYSTFYGHLGNAKSGLLWEALM